MPKGVETQSEGGDSTVRVFRAEKRLVAGGDFGSIHCTAGEAVSAVVRAFGNKQIGEVDMV